MKIFAALDVGDKATHICVLDGEGAVVWRGVCATDPEVVASTLERHAAGVERVVLETGPLSAFLYHGLIEREVPVVCICARHAKGALSVRVNKSDVHDAEGLAQLARTGWFKAVHIKGSATHLDRAQLKVRAAADPVVALLMTTPGTGPIIALTFKSSIEDPTRFERGEDVGAFAGLAPRRSQSGERDVHGRISKAGDPMLRSALYEAANNLLCRVKRPCHLQTWGKALVATKGAKRARVAVARKLAVLLHRLWISGNSFQWA